MLINSIREDDLQMRLSVNVEGDYVSLMRGGIEIGSFRLDSLHQIAEVVIYAAAKSEEEELIVRLAASHVAQFVLDRTVDFGVLFRQRRLSALPGCTPERSLELLDFDAIAPEHAHLSMAELEGVMVRVGVKIERRGRK